ncbi:MAG: M48 family metallopeptidase [Candidatus Hydrothermarchaeales archaeon]
MKIEIIRSPRRKKTISAKLFGEELRVYLPAGLTKAEEEEWIDKVIKSMERRKLRRELNADEGLKERAQELNHRYFGGKLKISSVEYVTNQNRRHGSCDHKKGTIRISYRLAEMPPWVRDYVIVHELAHLIYPNHSKAFWKAVNQYKYAERARGFLIAKDMEKDKLARG